MALDYQAHTQTQAKTHGGEHTHTHTFRDAETAPYEHTHRHTHRITWAHTCTHTHMHTLRPIGSLGSLGTPSRGCCGQTEQTAPRVTCPT